MIKVNIQSFNDIITNSSSEIYTQATEKTIKAIKDILQILLIEYKYKEPVDSVFDVHYYIDIGSYKYGDLEEIITAELEENNYEPKLYNQFIESITDDYSIDYLYEFFKPLGLYNTIIQHALFVEKPMDLDIIITPLCSIPDSLDCIIKQLLTIHDTYNTIEIND